MLLETQDEMLLLDCGMTALTSLGRAGVDPGSIDAVVVSHLHGDHFGGIPLLLLDASLRGRSRPLTIAGPPGARHRIQQALDIFGWSSVGFDSIDFVELASGLSVTIAGCEITGFDVSHNPLTAPMGLRIATEGATIGYSGDAAWSEALVEIARGADLFVCAVWSFDTMDPTFIDLATLLRQRDRLECSRIVLTHFGPEVLERLAEVPLDTASEGLTIEL
jgi:ribonuclease BN (tRNA processing enzyme)